MKKKHLVVLACIFLCVSILFSFLTIAVHADHDCIGEACLICVEIQQCSSLLKTLSCALVFLASAISLRFGILRTIENHTLKAILSTPVTLKVKLLN